MLVPVFLSMPRDELLVESALSNWRGAPKGVLPGPHLPGGFEVDSSYPAQPVGSRAAPPGRRRWLHPEESERFLVRGTIEVDSLDDLPESIEGSDVLADAMVDVCATCFHDAPVGAFAEVAAKLGVATLHENDLDGRGVAIAIVDTGINLAFLEEKLGFSPVFDAAWSWQPPGIAFKPGEFPVGHGTMCAYAALIAAPKAVLIDLPALVGTPAGGAPIGRRLSTIHPAVAHLSGQWSIAFTPSGASKYRALVLANSFAMYHPSWDFPPGHKGRYSDRPLHTFTRNIAGMSAIDGVDVVFAAGNCGGDCPDEKCQGVVANTITGANASAEVLTVGGCDMFGGRVGYSSQGPGIAGMAHQKPDLVAYTHFRGSEALGPGLPDKGTSTACPVAAGCIAALRTRLDPGAVPPAALNEKLRQTARSATNEAWDPDVGCGILDPLEAAREVGLITTV
jgi:Subtilase family